MTFLYANRVSTQLALTITTGDTTLNLMSGTGALFPAINAPGDAFAVTLVSASNQLQYEIAYCISRNGDALTVVRGQEGTAPLPFQSGDVVSLNMTAALYHRFPQAGYLGQFSQEVAQAPGGYRKGAIVCDDTPGTYWISLIDQNTTAPGGGNQTWRKLDTNGLLHPPDISGFALQSALQQEVQRAQAAEAGLLPLTGGTVTGTINRSGGGVLPEVIGPGLTGRVVQQAFVVVSPPRGWGYFVVFPQAFAPGTTPLVFTQINAEESSNLITRVSPLTNNSSNTAPMINNLGFAFQSAFINGNGAGVSGFPLHLQVLAIGVM